MNTDGDMITAQGAVIDDRQILQAELARVNLLRIRGDISSSKALCLSILKRFPESVDAHVMMGDLHSEQGDLAPAAEWYSLALDLNRTAPGVQVKLNRVQAALDISNQASRTRSLLASGRQISPWLYVAVAASAIAIGSVAYVAGLRTPEQAKNTTKPAISERISTPKQSEPEKPPVNLALGSGSSQVNLPTPDLGPTPASAPTANLETKTTGTKEKDELLVVEDQRLFDQVATRSRFGKHIISIIADPREKSMILTFNVAQGEHGRYTAAMLADIAMEYDNKAVSVTVRGVRNGVLSYIADVPREKIMAVEVREKKDVQDLENHSWIDEVLTNEYFKEKEVNKTPSI